MIGFVPKPFKTSELLDALYKALKKEGDGSEIFTKNEEEQVASNGRITSMEFLMDFTEGDEERVKKYVTMYLDSARINLPKIYALERTQKWDELKILIHSMKPHFDFMGMKYARPLAENIETILVEKKDLYTIPAKIKELNKYIVQSIAELADE
jgi:HPt (histidine-containing phosphotransfer) domain-containing protein